MRKDGGVNESENFGGQKQYKCHITKEKTGTRNNDWTDNYIGRI